VAAFPDVAMAQQWVASGNGIATGNGVNGVTGVGIGTPIPPRAPLDLGNQGGVKQLVYGAGGNNGYYMGLGLGLGQANAFSLFIGPPTGDGVSGPTSFEVVSATGQWPYTQPYNTLMTVQGSGNVGIGTVSPQAPLDVNGITRTAGFNNRAARTYFSGLDSAGYHWFGTDPTQEPNGLWLAVIGNPSTGTVNSVQIAPNNVLGLTVTSTGSVGIGTATPHHTLSVNGTLGAAEVVVTTAASADYVFAPDYRLAPLSEVNEYVKANGHLPEIPSAAEVAEKGVNLADMQAKLLAKIEELTLHMIAAEERAERLEKRNAELEDKVSRIRTQAGGVEK
jgi:hypothetical protein